LAKPIRFNTPQLAADVKRLDDELLIVTRSLSIFAAGPEGAVQAHPIPEASLGDRVHRGKIFIFYDIYL
jgi:hypothetical protein